MSFAEWSNQKKKEREEKNPSQISPSPTKLSSDKKELISFEEWSNKKHGNAEAEGTKANTTNGQDGWQKYLDDQASVKQQEAEEKEDEKWWEKLGRWLGDTGATDTTLPMGNTGQIVHDVRNDTSYTKPSDDWSDDQRYEFGALYLESPEKAYAYAEKINKENAKAKEEADIKKIQDSATSNPFAGAAHTIGAVVSSGLALADYLKMLVDGAAGKDPLESDGIVSPFEYSTAVTEGIATDLNDAYGTLDESIPIIGGKGWGDVYGLGTSIAQSAVSGYTLGPLGTLVSYFGQGAASGMEDALERGAEDWQAALYGAALGAFEGIAEQIGIDNLFKMGSASTLKGLLKNIVKQAGAEGMEEALTTFLSTMADDFIMQDKSQFNQITSQYMELGLSEEEAKKQASKDIWEGLAFDALAGAISGGVHGGAQTGIQTGISNSYAEEHFGNQSQDLVNDALNSPNSDVQKIGQKYQEKLNSGQTLSGWNLNELLEVTDTDKIQTAIQQRLESLGETGNVWGLAEILAKEQSGEELTKSERSTLENSQFGRDVYYEIERRKLNKSDNTNKWMENVGTRRTSPELYNKSEYVPQKTSEALPSTTQPTEAKESKYKSSESGKTTLKGEAVSILGIESIKNGEITVRLKDGKSVNASDLEFGSNTEALMYDIVGRMEASARTANMILRTVKPSNEALARMYYNSLPLAYEYGKIGYEAGLKNVKLPLNVKNNVYTRGRIDAMLQARIDTPQTNSTQDGTKKTDNGIIYENGFVYDEASANEMQRVSMAHIEVINKMTNLEVHVFESKVENGKRVAYINGALVSAPNGYFKDGNKIYIDFNAGNNGEGAMLYTMSHEITHYIREWNAKGFKELGDFLIQQYGKKGVDVEYLLEQQREKIKKRYAREGKALPSEAKLNDMAYEEMVADAMSDMLTDPNAYEKLATLKQQNKTLWEKVGEAIKAVLDKFKAALSVYKERDVAAAKEANSVREFSSEAYEKLQDLYIKAFVEADANYKESDLVSIDTTSESVSPMLSERTWTESEYVVSRELAAKKISKALGVTEAKALKYIDDINSIAKMIANDRARLDYEASSFGSAFVSNVEYGGSFDYTTLCKKRRIYTGTFTEIQKRLKDVALTPDDILKIRNMLIEEGVEATCGLCYVEGSRANMGKFAKEFIKLYKRDNPLAWIPNMADVNTPDGVEQMRISHPEAYEQYVHFWNHYGKLKDSDPALFASQQKPKLYEARKEYKGEILEHFKGDSTVAKKNRNGGIRMQSFSDFEIVHLIDTMQVIMDMSTVGLAGQAYTKVPEFARAFGDTGLKINLSLIAKGVDANGNLIFDDREGMPHETAFDLRNRHSKNVGTIIVTFTDEQLLAAMADPRIDFIIPFHRSQWKKGQYGAMGLPKGTKDYTYMQNEKFIKQTYHEYRGRMVKDKASNYMPNEYWDFSKSGKENAEAYLKMCAENNKRPKFYKLLNYDGKGTYSLKADGSTDGYWKLLIDFKMYDNDGVGSPQNAVTPTFNMDEARNMLDEYQGGHSKYPVASGVVDKFVNQYEDKGETKFSDRDSEYLDAVNRGDMDTAQKMVDEAAKEAGYDVTTHHGTNKDFTTFKTLYYNEFGYHAGTKRAAEEIIEVKLGGHGHIKKLYTKLGNTIRTPDHFGKIVTMHDYIYTVRGEPHMAVDPIDLEGKTDAFGNNFPNNAQLEKLHKMCVDWLNGWDSRYAEQAIMQATQDYFKSIGVDSIEYTNDAEDKGSTSYLLMNANQVKSADPVTYDGYGKVIPLSERFKADNDDIRYSDRDSSYLDAVNRGDMVAAQKMVDEAANEAGYTIKAYHGTNADFTVFDKNRVGKGNDQYGAGFYFASNPDVTEGYGTKRYDTYLDIKKPINLISKPGGKGKTLYDVRITQAQAYQILKRHPLMYDPENSPLGDFYDKYWEVGAKEWMVRDLAKNYDSIGLLDGDVILYRDYPNELHEAIRDVLGYDGVQVYFEIDAMVDERNDYFYVAWFDNQMKSSDPVVRDDNGNVIPLSERFKADNNDIRYSERDPYSYETLTSKPDMKITILDGTVPSNRADVVFQAKKNAASIGKTNKDGGILVHVDDINTDVLLGTDGLRHGLRRAKKLQNSENAIVTLKAGEILKNSIRINEFTPSKPNATASYVLIGTAKDADGNLYIVRSMVNQFTSELTSMDVLYAINAKKESAVLNAPRSTVKLLSYTDSTVSIAQLLEFVNRYFPDILPESVLRHYGYDARPEGDLGENVLYQDRDPNATSNRTILANALEAAAQNDLEKTKLNQYKRKISLIEAEQARLKKIKASLKKLYFAKGPKDTAKIESLQESARMIENRINTYDRQLLNLESTEALKAVLQREKQMAYNKAKKEGQEALRKQKEKNAATVKELMNRNTESRQKAIESRNKTAVREKIKRVVSDLNKLLLNPTQDKHVPIGLQKVVAEALDTINMDSMNAGERTSYYNDLILKSSNPDEVAILTKKRDFFAYRDASFKERITELKNAYAEFKESDDPLIRNAHNDAIADLIKNTADEVGDKSLKDMSLSQLERVYDMYKAVLATVRNANKMFKEGKQETVTENSDAVKLEVRSVGGHKDRVLKMTKFLKKFGWGMLKPLTAMKVIGSTTLERLFNNVRAAEDTWAVDVNEAKKYFEDIASKYGYKKWDLKKYYSFKDSAGTNISLSLEQIMSLYAYSKREQADKHLEFGGFIFDDSIEVIEKNKLGIPLKYEVNDANPYRLRKEHLLDITNALTKEQKDFVDAMQTYLSDVMGAKGNEVSLAMYDIKLYKEQNYFPLKTSRYFREFDPEKNATPKIKNSGFSKKTLPQAGNPIVLSNFMDVWASHVNDMSMYHAFVLPLEDFMRVYNYSSTIGGYDSVQQYIKNAYGAQANQYIERLMEDLNGGARVDSSAGIINKGLSLFKKASVFASASVVVQQPSAIARALAYINPKYFAKATHEALNIGKHKALWAEVKKYAPVAVIKEMGYFDTGVGRSTVEWIKGNQTFKDKMDDVLSKAPALADELCWVHIWEAVKRETIATKKIKYGTEDFFNECGRRFTEVITNTQVYDSVLSRSGMMRSKDTGMKMATAFMAEPTTTVNMMVDGIMQGIRGNKKFTAATVGAVSASIILNAILVSLVYAARDDDEDETYLEKYIGSVTSELLDGFNPLTYIPFVKDIWSIAQGYDVERSDMSVISKLWESIESLFNEDKSGLDKVLEMTGSIASLFGIPLKNIIRDAKGMYNLTNTILSGVPTTEAGIGYAIEDAFKSSIPLWDRLHESDSKTDKLYDAIMSGDQNQINRVKATYKSEQKLETALKTALRENDSRIKRAAQARLDGNILEYSRIAKEIIAEGHFSQDTVVAAINAEISAIKKAQSEPTESTDDKDEATSIYSTSDINAAFDNGDKALAISIINELVKMKVANGMDETKAKSSLRSSMTSYWKPLYLEAAKSGNKAEMQRIKQIMYYSGLYGSAADVVKAVNGWTK